MFLFYFITNKYQKLFKKTYISIYFLKYYISFLYCGHKFDGEIVVFFKKHGLDI